MAWTPSCSARSSKQLRGKSRSMTDEDVFMGPSTESGFSIIVDRNTTRRDWLQAHSTLLLDEIKEDEGFKRLFNLGGDLPRHCATKHHLIHGLDCDDWLRHFSRQPRNKIQQWLKKWKEESYEVKNRINTKYQNIEKYEVCKTETWEMTVYMDLRIAPSNNLEQSVFVYIEIPKGPGIPTHSKLDWWRFSWR